MYLDFPNSKSSDWIMLTRSRSSPKQEEIEKKNADKTLFKKTHKKKTHFLTFYFFIIYM